MLGPCAVCIGNILFVILTCYAAHRLYYRRTTRIITYRTTDSITQLFHPPNTTPGDLLTARAIPNKRLVRAFALTNTFVSREPRIHAAFVGHSNILLRSAVKRGWPHFQQLAIHAVETALPCSGSFNFDIFIQDVTLRVVLIGLLGVNSDISELNTEDIRVVTTLITVLWLLSKKPGTIPSDLLPRLNYHLRRLVPDENTYPNPLDYVIPVWETLWRVVIAVIEHVHSDKVLLGIFEDLHNNPTVDQFRIYKDNSTPSAEATISETMRLHPPTKRIVRALSINSASSILPQRLQRFSRIFRSVVLECADIEGVLRSTIWGPNAEEFLPLRHLSRLSPDQEIAKSFIFGGGRHRCIAASWAPMAAGIIVAAVLNRLGSGKNYKLVAGPRVGGREGWEGWIIIKDPLV